MAEKQTRLSIVLRTVDKATAKLKAVNDRLDAITKPIRDFKEQLADIPSKSGLADVADGFKGVGAGIMDVVGKLAMIAGVAAAAVAGVVSLIGEFDDLGDKAEAMGVSVDFLAGMESAARKTGGSVEELDTGLQSFSKNMGLLRANGGGMLKFLSTVSPALVKQLKATKNNEEALDLLAGAMKKIEDPAKRAAFASKTLGSPTLAPLFHKGADGVKALREEFLAAAGSQEEAAKAAGEFDDESNKMKDTIQGIKAALVSGLAPALTVIVAQLREWFTAHRGDIKEWAAALGRKLPDAFQAVRGAVVRVVGVVRPFVDSAWKLKLLAVALAGVIAGPLIASVYSLGVALATTPVGWIVAGIAAISAGAYLLITNWEDVSAFFTELWDTVTGGFTWASALIKAVLAPFIGVPLVIVSSWGTITEFFSDMWDGVTGVFQKAWDFIAGIVGKVTGAIGTVKDGISDVIDFLNPFGDDDEGASTQDVLNRFLTPNGASLSLADAYDRFKQSRESSPSFADAVNRFAASGRQDSSTKVTVDFANAPRGTRVSTDPQSTADVDLTVGYQLLGAQ